MTTTMTSGDRLAERFISLAEGLDRYERFNLHLLMSVAVGGVAPHGDIPTSGARREAWKTGIRVLNSLTPAGLAYVGRPAYLPATLLQRIEAEAREREGIAHRTGPQELSPGGEAADEFAAMPELLAHVAEVLGEDVEPTGISTYLYYNKEGDHLYPHVDTEIFAVNCILMVEHTPPADESRGSALVIYEPTGEARRVWMEPGEMSVLRASGSVHGRDEMGQGERVTILTIGLAAVEP